MRSREISIPGMGIAALLCLTATGMSMTDATRYAPLALTLFAFAWLIFYVSAFMPFWIKKTSRD